MSFLCFRMEFADSRSHGRGDQGVPEWPPSPLRLFQALIAAAASHWNERETLSHAVPALQWLEAQPPPSIVAPKGTISETKCQFYVPDNTGEKAVPAWKKGEKSDYPKRVEKVVQPVHLKDSVLHYLYSLDGEGCPHFEVSARGGSEYYAPGLGDRHGCRRYPTPERRASGNSCQACVGIASLGVGRHCECPLQERSPT